MDFSFYPLRILDIQAETADSKVIRLAIPEDLKEKFNFRSGQNITLRFVYEGKEERRSYSINTAPYEQKLEIGVRKLPGGLFSDIFLPRLKAGDFLEVMPPTGSFTIMDKLVTSNSYVFIAAGSGITPIISMIKELLYNNDDAQVTLVYGNRDQASIMFLEQLQDLKDIYLDRFQLIYMLSRESLEHDLFSGRITAERAREIIQRLVMDFRQSAYFLCGPEAMVLEIRDMLTGELDIPATHIHFELFFTGAATAKSIETAAQISGLARTTYMLDGKETTIEINYSGQSILDSGSDAGLDLPYACKGGVCGTCKAKLEKGEVVMDSNFALEEDELKAGYILTCQSHPRSSELYVNYDY